MRLRKLSNDLKSAYGGSDVRGRVNHFDGWMDRAHVENAGSNDYDHAATVKEYYDLCNEFMVFGWSGLPALRAVIAPGEPRGIPDPAPAADD